MKDEINDLLVEEEMVAYGQQKPGYDLEERTYKFAQDTRSFVKNLTQSIWNKEDIKQLVRASGSVGANYIEANESFSKKDFAYRVKIARKESKESRYFLKLLDVGNDEGMESKRQYLSDEAKQLVFIFTAILKKVK